MAVILFSLPYFFSVIEKRNGISLNDILLSGIPAFNLSLPLFIIIWSMIFYMLFRCIQNPQILIVFLWSYILLSIVRMITISLLPLEPPAGLIVLNDPLTNFFYGQKFITKDLFFSGHMSSQFLIFLCLKNKNEKIVALASTLITGIIVLIQHVHYTIDVIAVPFFCTGIYYLALKFTKDVFILES